MSTLSEKIEKIKEQERTLIFDSFTSRDAYRLGTLLIEKAETTGVAYGINITLNRRQLFHFSMEGATPDNDRWIARKENTVYHFFASSYRVRLELEKSEEALFPRFGLHDEEYVLAGGSFPIIIKGAGVVGTVTVSGLPEEDDHKYVTSAIKAYINNLKGEKE